MPKAKLAPLIIIFTITVGGCGVLADAPQGATEFAPTAGADQPDAEWSQGVARSEVEAALMEILIGANRSRLEANRPPLVASAQLMEAAQARSVDMAELGYFDHIHPLRGTAEIERLLRPNFPDGQIAELLYLDDCSLDELPGLAIEAWLADEENRAALLRANFNLIGAGAELGQSGWYAVLALAE